MLFYLLGTLFVIISILLIIVVLLQKGRGGGLGAAFGGSASSAFGTKIGDVFTWVTIVLTALFLLLAVGTSLYFRPKVDKVATPIFAPAPQEVQAAGPVSVRMGSPTADAEIHYTLDGSEPTQESTRYDAPVQVKQGTTVKARAYRTGGWKPSEIRSEYYGGPSASQPASGPASAPAAASAAAPAAPASAPATSK